jgi:hypothetical protein
VAENKSRSEGKIGRRTLEFNFIGIRPDEKQPKIALFVIGSKGIIKKFKPIEGNSIEAEELSRLIASQKGTFAIGPDIDEKLVTKEMLVTYRASKFDEWKNSGIIEVIPKWRDWLFIYTCVHGSVRKCTPIWWPLVIADKLFPTRLERSITARVPSKNITARAKGVAINPEISELRICAPICNAVVEIYQKTCCCDPRIIIDECIPCKIFEWLEEIPPIPDPGPIFDIPPKPEPIPKPGPGPDPAPFKLLSKSLKQTLAVSKELPLGNIPERLISDAVVMSRLAPEKQLEYIDEHYYLKPLFCSCSSKKIGETTVNESGEFSFCFPHIPRIHLKICTTTYYYKVKQFQGNKWVYIYDGSTVNEYFKADEEAAISTWKGQACQPPGDVPDTGDDFVLLEYVGLTPSYKLQSPDQDSEYGVSSADPTDGLLDSYYDGDTGTITNAPWGQTLALRLKFTEGLKAKGAKYYKVSIVEADSDGNPIGTPTPLLGNVTWYKWDNVGGDIKPVPVHLGPDADGFIEIPYEADAPLGWLWLQYHQKWNTISSDTTSSEPGIGFISDDKYLVIVEIFDPAKNRLKPSAAPGTGTGIAFNYRKWEDFDNTEVVNFAALTHMFHVNNVHCYADIVDFRKNGTASLEECQYIVGCPADTFSVGFYAFHEDEFMNNYILWYHRGLSGNGGTIETGTSNAPTPIPAVLNSTNAKESNALAFEDMLTDTSTTPDTVHPRCTFAIRLYAYAKHTNGSGRIEGYDSQDTAAVSLDQSCPK